MTAETFFKELNSLIQSQPKLISHNNNSENCEYGDQLYFCKNMMTCFDCLNSNECVYLFDSQMCNKCADSDYVFESELCYECVDIHKCFNSEFLEYCTNMVDSSYSFNCRDCTNVFGCVGLNNKTFCLFNRQLSEADYKEQVKKYKSMPSEKILKILEELKAKFPMTQTHSINNENSPYGNYMYNCKNCYMCFDALKSENCGYLYDSGFNTTCYDSIFSGDSDLSYEFIDSTHVFNCNYVIWSGYCNDSSYIIMSSNLKNCIGCVNIINREYCILNRQLTKEEYEKESKELLEELKTKNLGWDNIKI